MGCAPSNLPDILNRGLGARMTIGDIGWCKDEGRRRKGDRVRYVTNSYRMAGTYPWAFGSGADRLGELWLADDTGPCYAILEGLQAIHVAVKPDPGTPGREHPYRPSTLWKKGSGE